MREKVANFEKKSPNNEKNSQNNYNTTFIYNCILCNYNTNKLGDFKKHKNSNKHILKSEKEKEINIKEETEKTLQEQVKILQQEKNEINDELNNLKSKYKILKIENDKLKTKLETTIEKINISEKENNELKEKIEKLTEDKEKIRDKHTDQLVHIIETTKGKTINNNCNNINIILNTQCKDAINLSELIENIKNNITLDDIDNGVNAMAKIKEALNNLQPKDRPFVCENPSKRLLYFKNDNEWLLDNEVKKTKKFLSDMGTYMQIMLIDWRKSNKYGPQNEDKKLLKYQKLLRDLDPGTLSKKYELDYDDAIKELCRLTDIKYLK